MKKIKPTLLLILDGWGASKEIRGNAILAANTPNWDKLIAHHPYTEIEGCGDTVGLPDGQMGNSEVGHLTMGAGRVLYQDLTKINHAILNRSFFKIDALQTAFSQMAQKNQAVHILGLLSPGGVHSHEEHLFAVLEFSRQFDCPVYIHAFLDGRDTPPKSALASMEKLEALLDKLPNAQLASIMGRFYGMDRDRRWDRVQAAFDTIAHHTADKHFATGSEALHFYFAQDITDEFIPPSLIGKPCPSVTSEDTVLFMNFRSDRARQLSHALTDVNFKEFDRKSFTSVNLITLTEYDKTLPATVLFPKERPKNVLGEFFQDQWLTQLRIAETEKYAHVTFFFNGGLEEPFKGEDRILIPSPKVKTYDEKPEMSAIEITDRLIDAIESNRYDVIICNFANADMVGHTGNFKATVQAIECLDQCIGRILSAIEQKQGAALITADHGNADCMLETHTNNPHTAHTLAKVPLVYYGKTPFTFINNNGSLQDVAPTLLALLGLTPPKEMTGKSLLKEKN